MFYEGNENRLGFARVSKMILHVVVTVLIFLLSFFFFIEIAQLCIDL